MISWILTLLFIFSLSFLYKYIISPYRLVLFYSRQGFKPKFYPFTGYLHFLKDSYKQHKDMLYIQTQFARTHPSSRGMVINNKDYVILWLFDMKLKRSFYLNNDKYIKRKSGTNQLMMEVIGEENLLLSEFDEWKRRRKIISKAFNFEFIKSLNPLIIDTCNTVFHEIINDKKLNQVNIMNLFQEITGRSFVNSFFGEEMSGLTFEGELMTTALNNLVTKCVMRAYEMLSFIFGGNVARKLRLTKEQRELHQKILRFKEKIGNMIKSKHVLYLSNELPKNNLLYIFFQQNPDINSSLQDLIHEYIMLYVAGTDTTGHWIAHALHLLLKHPAAKEKLLAEIKETPNLEDEKIDWETLHKMPYLNAILKETLRLKPPVADIGQRLVIKDFKLEDIWVKKGTVLQNGFYMNAFDPKYFEEPDKFYPERWMKGGKNEKLEDEEPYLFVPFSAGNRNCIGQHLARFEAMIALVKFMRKFDFEWKNETYEEKWMLRFLYETRDPVVLNLKVKA